MKRTGQTNAAELWSTNDVYQLQQVQTSAFAASMLFTGSDRGAHGSLQDAAQQ